MIRQTGDEENVYCQAVLRYICSEQKEEEERALPLLLEPAKSQAKRQKKKDTKMTHSKDR